MLFNEACNVLFPKLEILQKPFVQFFMLYKLKKLKCLVEKTFFLKHHFPKKSVEQTTLPFTKIFISALLNVILWLLLFIHVHFRGKTPTDPSPCP